MVNLNGYVVNELDFTNELKAPGQLNLETRTNFNVQYMKDANRCIATCVVDMMEKTAPNDFNFKISVRGIFEYEEGMSREEIHTATYDELFPFVRTITCNTFVNAGLPPMMIQKVKMDPSKINVSGGQEEKPGLTS
ncbi:MAG: protein-export chaperone SecB [Lachnospiraceae bacterium]|nr:protein-export chaperone SecB [Lachnospiraceae bacterium]